MRWFSGAGRSVCGSELNAPHDCTRSMATHMGCLATLRLYIDRTDRVSYVSQVYSNYNDKAVCRDELSAL